MEENTVDSDSTATTRQVILAVFDGMTIAEITAFRRAFEARYNVSSTAPPGKLAPPPDDEREMVDTTPEPTEFDVVLTGIAPDANRINVIRVVHELTNLGLGEARDAVVNAPTHIREAVTRAEVEIVRGKLADAGATVEITGR